MKRTVVETTYGEEAMDGEEAMYGGVAHRGGVAGHGGGVADCGEEERPWWRREWCAAVKEEGHVIANNRGTRTFK